jgi:hypothetical protein
MELSFAQATKVWWSYLWRQAVLYLPVLLVMIAVLRIGVDQASPPPPGTAPQWLAYIPLATLPFTLVIQILALRWTLKTRWSDFHIAVVPSEEKSANT